MTQVRSSITDIPRLAGEDDKFGIEPFEKGLISFIDNTSTPITIALQGEWGSGKTSLMNTMRQQLADGDNSNFHSIWLNTWEFALMNDTRTTLFEIVSNLIDDTILIASEGKSKGDKFWEGAKKLTGNFTRFVTKTAVNKLYEGGGDEIDKYLEKDAKNSIIEIRIELEKIIAECIQESGKKGFIFFIDDLDRIDPPAAVELLELLKNIFTLNNCVFVLAIDYDVVVKGLEPKFGKLSESNEREFRSFFDKIIQVPFSMPVANYQIDVFLKESLMNTNYLSSELANNIELISKFSEVANLTVGTNPRALKRLMNSLSLISCINTARDNKDDDEQLKDDLELLVNFALVSIQIAYPAVYRLLTLHSGFDKWNESVALQMNLKELDAQSKEKLNKSEEFDEEWEQVLFRLCENDFYLKKKALNISRLLNTLKATISENGDNIEDIIDSVISLSSVTNLEAFDKPVVDYHRGSLLKGMRNKLVKIIPSKMPADFNGKVQQQGARIQANLFLKFSNQNWGDWVQLTTHPYEGGIRLITKTVCYLAPVTGNDHRAQLREAGLLADFEKLEEDFNALSARHPDFSQLPFDEWTGKVRTNWEVTMWTYLVLPNVSDFKLDTNIDKVAEVIAELYEFRLRVRKIYEQLKD